MMSLNGVRLRIFRQGAGKSPASEEAGYNNPTFPVRLL
jgi:hypothetical protein